jgi:hypothetical protein
MDQGKIYQATTFVVLGMLVMSLGCLEGCGGYVAGGGSGSSITGIIVNATTKTPVAGALVVLEQGDVNGIDRVISSTTSGSAGSFSFNPSSSGLFDVVADATATSTSGTVTYAATVTFGVPVGTNLNQIPVVPEFGSTTPTGTPATIFGTVSTAGNNITFINSVDVQLSALQLVSPAVGSVNQITIPAFAGSTASVTTVTSNSCLNGTTCILYTLLVPQGVFSAGRFSASGTQYNLAGQQQTAVSYTVEGRAFAPLSPLFPDCSPSSMSTILSVSSGTATGNPNLSFTGCI